MTKFINLIIVMFATMMLMSPDAQAQQQMGKIYVMNNNCVEPCGFLKNCARVDVHLYTASTDADDKVQCTETGSGQYGPWIHDIAQRSCGCKTVTGRAKYSDETPWKMCTYRAQAAGVAAVTRDNFVDGAKTSVFTCANDWAGVCQCRELASSYTPTKLPDTCVNLTC